MKHLKNDYLKERLVIRVGGPSQYLIWNDHVTLLEMNAVTVISLSLNYDPPRVYCSLAKGDSV